MGNKRIRRGKKQMRVEGIGDITGEDRISRLPDPLLCQILLHLSTEDVVRTSILSSRWRSLWQWVPGLHLYAEQFKDHGAFLSFVDKFLDFHSGDISKFDLSFDCYYADDMSCVQSWINTMIERKLQHLSLTGCPDGAIPPTLFTCQTLVSLELYGLFLDDLESVSLPCLKSMGLWQVDCSNDTMETLISCCSTLEDLIIDRFPSRYADVIRVRSQTLKSFKLDVDASEYDGVVEVVIDAPKLKYLKSVDLRSDIYTINSLDSSATVDIDVSFHECSEYSLVSPLLKRDNIRKFLVGISSARRIIFSRTTLEVIHRYFKTESLPQFKNLSCLSAEFYYDSLPMLPAFLKSCPNLKSITVQIWEMEMEHLRFSSVPHCFLSSLEFVDIESPITTKARMKSVKYLLEHAAVLKKLIIRSGHSSSMEEENAILKKLLTFPRRSSACEVVVR